MIKEYLDIAKSGKPVWIGDVRRDFALLPNAGRMAVELTGIEGMRRGWEIRIPIWKNEEERAFVQEYVAANVFNLLSCFGGKELCFYYPEDDRDLSALLSELEHIFQLDKEKRNGYGKVITISSRLIRAFGGGHFSFTYDSMDHYQAPPAEETCAEELGDRLRLLTKRADAGLRCGIDVGGTDIKAAVSRDGSLLAIHELDWDPASCRRADELLEPILLLIRLLQWEGSCPTVHSLPQKLDLSTLRQRLTRGGQQLVDDLRPFDSIGLSFPDVVIQNRILGGETPKTQGLRNNPSLQYETEFSKLSGLLECLRTLCTTDGTVRIANDGNIAAFTAAVEMACQGKMVSNGVFAHTLGTDLGTGWLLPQGKLPPLPLEMYDFMIDLGSRPQHSYPPEDVRSVLNENTGLADARKDLGQSAAFRLAAELDPKLLQGFLTGNEELLTIQKQPEDLRKLCLEHLMQEAAKGNPSAQEVFKRIGQNLGQISREIDWMLNPNVKERYLYGRFVKHPECFTLLQEGCRKVMPELELIAADENLACSPLMQELAATMESSVAQFGQAVGAIYFGLTD